MEKIKEHIKKVCEAIIEKFKELAKKISDKLQEASYIALQQTIKLLIKRDPSNAKVKIPITKFSDSDFFCYVNPNIIKDALNAYDEAYSILVNEERDSGDFSYTTELSIETAIGIIDTQTEILMDLINESKTPNTYVTLFEFSNEKLYTALLRNIKTSQHSISMWEDTMEILIRNAEKSGFQKTSQYITTLNNHAIKYFNTCLRFQNMQLQQLSSGVKKAVSEIKNNEKKKL